MQVPPFGTVDLSVVYETPDEAPVQPVAASFTITDSMGARTFSTNASGVKTITYVAGGGPFTIEVKHPLDTTNITMGGGVVTTDDELVPVAVTLPALGTVTGTVTYADGSPAPLAAVELSGTGVTPRVGTTNGSGVFTFDDVEGLHPFSVLARHPAADRDHIFRIAAGEVPENGASTDVTVALPGTGTVEVTVTENDGSTPVSGANVTILESFDGDFRSEGATDAAGRLDVTLVPEGSFTVSAEIHGDEIGTATDEVPIGAVGSVVAVTISKPPEATLEGTVYAADGLTPVPGARVRFLTEDGATELDSRLADTNGFYRFAWALSVSDTALVRAEDASDASANDEVFLTASAPGQTLVADFTLPLKVVSGTVFESDGLVSVPGARVDAVLEGGYVEKSAIADASGDFALLGVEDGTYELVATDPDGLTGYASATLGVGDDSVERDVTLPPFAAVEGTVLDETGAPPVGVESGEIALHNANVPSPRTTPPDATGRFRFERVAEGSFTLVYDDAASGLSGAATSFVIGGESLGESVNIARTFGVEIEASTEYNSAYAATLLADGDASTSWLSKYKDTVAHGGSPFVEVRFPHDAIVNEIRLFGKGRWSRYYIYAGYFEIFDESGGVLFDSGVVDFSAPDYNAVVPVPSIAGARRVRLTVTDDYDYYDALGELEIYGTLAKKNLSLEPGVVLNPSSVYSSFFAAEKGIDGDLKTNWFTRPGDAVNRGGAPHYEILFPTSYIVDEIQMFGNRSYANGYDFHAGRFELFDVSGGVLFDSGVVDLPAPDRDITVPVSAVAGVARVRFTATADEGNDPGFSELVVWGRDGGPGAPPTDINLPATGSVSGQLLAAGGATTVPVGTATIEASSSATESRSGVVSASGAVDAAGLYHVAGVAEGDVTVTVVDDGLGAAGTANANVSAGVETTDVDVELQTGQALPVELGLPAKRHLVRADGSIEGELNLASAASSFASASVNGKAFPDRAVAGLELSGRQLVLGPVRMSGLDHTRQVYVPDGAPFARVLDIFENPHTFDVQLTVRLDGVLNGVNLTTSSGDGALDAADRYLAGELDTGPGIAVIYAGAGATRLPDASATDGTAYSATWRRLVVPAGSRIILMTFAVQRDTRADALAEADALMHLTNPGATSDLTAAEKTDILNFIVP